MALDIMKELAIKLGEWESCLGELVAKDEGQGNGRKQV